MVMHSRTSGQRGFMTAESLTSLFFYIVMVAAIAGVAAMVMSKTAGAKGASALAIARANIQGMGNIMDYVTASTMTPNDATHKVADAAGVIPGVGTMTFVARPTAAAPTQVAINIEGVLDADVCRALGTVGFGTWAGAAIMTAPITSGGALPATSAPAVTASGTVTSGKFPQKSLLEKACSDLGKATGGTGMTMVFITR